MGKVHFQFEHHYSPRRCESACGLGLVFFVATFEEFQSVKACQLRRRFGRECALAEVLEARGGLADDHLVAATAPKDGDVVAVNPDMDIALGASPPPLPTQPSRAPLRRALGTGFAFACASEVFLHVTGAYAAATERAGVVRVLHVARIAEEDARASGGGGVVLSFEAKRAKFARIIAQNPQLTLAARQGEAMDEAEIDGYLADLAELGITDATEKDDT